MFRGVARGLTPALRRIPVHQRAVLRAPHMGVRTFSSQSELDARLQQMADAIRNNPQLKQKMLEVKQMFEEKGVLQDGKPPSVFKMSMLLMDKRVMSVLQQLYGELEKSNISCSPEDLKGLLALYNQKKP